MRVIGLDIHRSFAVSAVLENGQLRTGERVVLERDAVVAFAKTLRPDDEVVLEATGNTAAVVRLISPHVAKVAIANPIQVRAIAWAKVKTDKIDAGVLAKLHASGFLPEVWSADEDTQALRRLVAERVGVVSSMTRVKNRIHAVLHANLIPPYKGNLFSKGGRQWLAAQPLPEDHGRTISRQLNLFDQLAVDLATFDATLARRALADPRAERLMTIGGVNAVVAVSLLAAIGDVSRFSSPEKLVSYVGLNPSVRQSGDRPAVHGRITKQGRAHARAMLVEAAWAIAAGPGPLRVLHPHQGTARAAGRGGRDGPQARGSRLAPPDEGGGLRLGPPRPRRLETAQARAAGWRAVPARWQQARTRERVQPASGARPRAPMARHGGGGVPAFH